jgi:enterochelin esterase-like enzyme
MRKILWAPTLLMLANNCFAGTISTQQFFSRELGRGWKYKLYLPDGYAASELSYPVLYLLHGSDGDENAWNFGFSILDDLTAQKKIPPLIAIAPASGTSWWVDGVETFESAFFDDLIPEVESKYRTLKEREGRALAGYSMGGYGVLRYALAYPEIFVAAVMLSPALYDGLPPLGSSARSSGAFGDPFDEQLWTARNYPTMLPDYLQKEMFVAIYIACGDDDFHHVEDFKFNIEQQSTFLYGRLHKQGGSPAELRIMNGGHNTNVWEPAFREGVPYMFQFLKSPTPPVSVEAPNSAPDGFELFQNYPNPFNPETTIQYHLPQAAKVTLAIYDVTGREIKTLISEEQASGSYRVLWNGRNDRLQRVTSGVYFYRLTAATLDGKTFTRVRKVLVMK